MTALTPKPARDFTYVSMASRGHWLLLRESLRSLHRAWLALPRILIVSDGSWSADEFRAHFDFWPDPIEICNKDEILAQLAALGQHTLANLARRHPLNLKLGAICVLARSRTKVLFVDSDVLWFSDPAPILTEITALADPVITSEASVSVNRDLTAAFCPELDQLPGPNTGCVWLQGELLPPCSLQPLLDAAAKSSDNEYTEQTIIGIASKQQGRRFPRAFCMVEFDDAFAVRRRRPEKEGFHARHYVRFMRHQFYRDALALQ